MKTPAFLDITPCSPLKADQLSASYVLLAGSLLSLFFGSEDGGHMFLLNVDWLSRLHSVISQKIVLIKVVPIPVTNQTTKGTE
jgi:hypothetical protein